MSEPLLLIDQLLAKVRHLENLGCRQEAQRLLTRLTNFRNLPEPAALEVRTRLARLFLRSRFGAARHHLTAALLQQPRHAFTHFLLAHAAKMRGQEDLDRAAEHLRQAIELAPRRPRYWVAYGNLLLKQGKLSKGLGCLRRAMTLAPDDVGVLTRVVRGLVRAEQWQEARQAVQAALFLLPECPAVAKLWSDVRFQEARGLQQRQRNHQAERLAENAGPTLLPFVRPQPLPVTGKLFRLDGTSGLPAPHFPRSLRLSDQKHA